MKNIFCTLVICWLSCSCSGNGTNNNQASSSVQQDRANPNPNPAATFSENINTETGKLNNWKFAVNLYETHQTFTYRIQVQYGETIIEDSFQFPDLHIAPKPALQKGKDDYSCVIGFMDDKNTFRDFKLVTTTDGNIHIRTLKYYGVQQSTAP